MDKELKKDNVYKLTLKGNGVSVEKEISEAVARRIMTLALGGGMQVDSTFSSEPESSPITNGATPKQFMAAKRPASDIERVTCLAFYLSHYRDTKLFKTVELTKLNTEAAQQRLSNPTVAARNAVQQDYLSLAGGGKKQITSRGEAVVDALPDRGQVKAVLDAAPIRRRRVRRVAKRSSQE